MWEWELRVTDIQRGVAANPVTGEEHRARIVLPNGF
jgi:hypothetical protein